MCRTLQPEKIKTAIKKYYLLFLINTTISTCDLDETPAKQPKTYKITTTLFSLSLSHIPSSAETFKPKLYEGNNYFITEKPILLKTITKEKHIKFSAIHNLQISKRRPQPIAKTEKH